jgi:NAD(P)-dependent dehydrogenase (short-subunit alcohol dehydrogenase family)
MESLNFFESKQLNEFQGKNVLITGATGGIGSITTELLVKMKANVIVTSRSDKKVAQKLGGVVKKDNFDREIINFESPGSINRGFVSIMEKFAGRIDVIIICHAIFKVGKLMETGIDAFDSTLNVNVRSIFHLISMASPFLKLSRGNVVVLSSIESFIPISMSFLNSVSKVIFIYIYIQQKIYNFVYL